MPRIRFIRVRCPHCGVEYKVWVAPGFRAGWGLKHTVR
jgi:ribosomal protein S27E